MMKSGIYLLCRRIIALVIYCRPLADESLALIGIIGMLSLVSVQSAYPQEFTMKPLEKFMITQPTGQVYISFYADVLMRDISNYQFLLSIGSLEGNCQKNPNVDINQTIQNVITPQTIHFDAPNSCREQFNFGTVSNPCLRIRPHIKAHFWFTIDVNKLNGLTGQDLQNWNNLHLSIRQQNAAQPCTSQPLFISATSKSQIKIGGLDDMELTQRAKDRYKQDEPFCVFVTDAGKYKLKASGGFAEHAEFLLTNGDHSIPYIPRLVVNKLSERLKPGIWSNEHQGSKSINCDSTSNAKMQIVLHDSAVENKPPGNYIGTLFITVELQ
ncbi:hypothetical protein [Endozoicomonas ascidiicola]|uniref:hypothetical protein n=1 Tax=Endozoicomonas ascidiicola TaxID=1698521 RepID=UPI0008314D5D|nr:hypothetical protein [Endozoicomonas ascidiicola]